MSLGVHVIHVMASMMTTRVRSNVTALQGSRAWQCLRTVERRAPCP